MVQKKEQQVVWSGRPCGHSSTDAADFVDSPNANLVSVVHDNCVKIVCIMVIKRNVLYKYSLLTYLWVEHLNKTKE